MCHFLDKILQKKWYRIGEKLFWFINSDRSSYSVSVLVVIRTPLSEILSISANIYRFSL